MFYKQVKGIAMGSICGPSIANLFVLIYEKKWLSVHRPLIYYRFIDDLFLVVNNSLSIDSLKNSFGSLRLTFEVNDKVKYLDLEIKRDDLTSYLDFSMYFKPTNTFSYLKIDSNHPKYIFKNLIKSLLIRVRRICSKFSNFIIFASKISFQLVSRGYSRTTIDKIFTMTAKLDRDILLQYKPKKVINYESTFIIKNKFDNNILNFKELATKAFTNFKAENPLFKDYKVMIINSMQNNISSLLVNNFKFPFRKSFCYNSCQISNCNICIFSNKNHNIFLTERFILPIFTNSDCSSENVIYLIFCSFCRFFYIGQSNSIKNRIYNHINDIKKFKPFSDDNTSVSIHFNLKHHDFKSHFSFFVFRRDILNLNERLNLESFLINLCRKLDVRLMNDHIPILKFFFTSQKFLGSSF